MPLDLEGKHTKETLDRLEQDGHNELTIEAGKDSDGEHASLEVSHEQSTWSVAAFIEWARAKGFGWGGRGKIKF